jgi:two-component sensor histidine kinase
MALHELATNATKYGALSNDQGRIDVTWAVNQNPADPKFTFSWRESGGPTVTKPSRRGFGSRMIEQALASYFTGSAELNYDPNGLTFSVKAPVSGLMA